METILTWIDYAGIAVFAITGCLVAARRKLDVVSFILLAVVTGVGGGTLRDMMLGRMPVFWVQNPLYLMDCVIVALAMFLVAQKIDAYSKWIIWGDAVGIAVFTVTGTKIAHDMGAAAPVSVFMGVVTSVVGGIIRDLLAGEPSLIVRKEIYATACMLGATVFLLAQRYVPELAVPLSMASTFGLRAAAIHFRLQLPGYEWVDEDHPKRREADRGADEKIDIDWR